MYLILGRWRPTWANCGDASLPTRTSATSRPCNRSRRRRRFASTPKTTSRRFGARSLRCSMRHQMRFFAVVRDKRRVAELIQEHNRKSPAYRYHPNQLYDRCVSRLFKERLHQDDGYVICFSKRGAKDRTGALMSRIADRKGQLPTVLGHPEHGAHRTACSDAAQGGRTPSCRLFPLGTPAAL